MFNEYFNICLYFVGICVLVGDLHFVRVVCRYRVHRRVTDTQHIRSLHFIDDLFIFPTRIQFYSLDYCFFFNDSSSLLSCIIFEFLFSIYSDAVDCAKFFTYISHLFNLLGI